MLYDHVVAHDLKWPSLTVKWLPDPVEKEGCVVHRLVIGTHASPGQQNHVNIAEVRGCDQQRKFGKPQSLCFWAPLNHSVSWHSKRL